jgi:hypothetical protein
MGRVRVPWRPALGADVLRAYLVRAKQHDPFFPEELTGARPALETGVEYRVG